MSRMLVVLLVCVTVFAANISTASEMPRFETRVLDPNAGNICYAVTAADVDGDKRQDVVVVTENRVLWYQNPDWKPWVIIADQTERDNVCIAPLDIDGDGQVDFALGAGWTKVGTIQWLARGKSLDDKWSVYSIGKEGWTHRLRFGDILGTGKPQLVVSPLNKTVSEKGVRLTAFEIPADPRTQAWRATVLDESLNAMHNHWMGDLDGDGHGDVVTASQDGVFLFRKTAAGIAKTQLAAGAESLPAPVDPANAKNRGNGEIKVGKLKNGQKFLATVGPMHGSAAIIYTQPKDGELWTAHALDRTLNRGHAVGVGDFDGDGTDEVVIGHSDKGTAPTVGPGLYVYRATDDAGTTWERQILDDGGIATEDLVVEDFNGDGRPDIAACGRATHNVKLYLTLPTKSR